MKEPLPNVCKLVDGVPQSMENIILKACAKNPSNRYDSAREMYSDLKDCLDEEAPIQQRVVYRYPEDDLEETKTLTNLREVSRSEKRRKMEKEEIQESKEDDIEDLQEKKQSKKLNIALWISGIIVAIIGMAMIAVIFIIPALTKAKDVKIPDVSGMTVEKAEAALIKAGLEVDVDVTEEESDEVEEGLVIETSPKANRTVKEGQTIKLTVSLGEVKIEIEDYTNKNYLEVKGALETLGLKVTIEKKDVEETEGKEYDANIIIDQSIKKGEKVDKDTEIILYTPNVLVKYPDFTTYTLEQITAWCTENKITLTVEYEETSTYPAGTIMYQSRDVGDIVVPNATLKIGIAKVATTTPDTTTTTTEDK